MWQLAREQDSNLRPQAYETCKLTNCSTPHCSVGKGKDKIETHQTKSLCKACRRERFGEDDINNISLYRIGSRLVSGVEPKPSKSR